MPQPLPSNQKPSSKPAEFSITPTVSQIAAMPDEYLPLRNEFAHITQKMYTQNLALSQTNSTLSILRAIDLLILESKRDLPHLSTDISQAIINSSTYVVVGILSLNRHNDNTVNMQGIAYSNQLEAGRLNGSFAGLDKLSLSTDTGWLNAKTHNLIVNLEGSDVATLLEANGFGKEISTASANLHQLGVGSFYFTKLFSRNKLNGVLMIGLSDSMPKIDDIELIERLSEPAGIALDNRLLFEENQRFLLQLQTNNTHLKELDQAKDEFISLVSHQLRTPLTSIKGLLSLVLEGDTGSINDQQRSMLQQAFDSSQRMVFVIADLLNASRLRSGKFIIDNKVTFLPDVVSTEMEQLLETAATRNIKLYFNKPADFPKLMLDETKIRQVIMNFLDNALYYTRSGGWIKVNLQADDKSVEYTVTDNGMGVPKEECNKLFTKFYRAANARKMRPEGTGLGLYMAKKVVIAQGGAIIFKSEEGRGSVFGFVFPRSKVEATPEQIAAASAKP